MIVRGGLSPSFDAPMPTRSGRIVERLIVERVDPPAMLCKP
jgi:hypothetical protein